ncbi:Cutinase [Rhizoctonia solani]|uniref:Cutinase n=1 Tax=Rhizoctonia solani TaxID=456999 RepID=A0A8H7I2Y7_9AGAM|nr:Cutinase [Rhizoctonia solani]
MISKHLAVTALFFGVVLGAPAQTRHSCSNVQLVHAAGTTENGLGLVGAPLAKALASAIPGTTSYAIPYNTGPKKLDEQILGPSIHPLLTPAHEKEARVLKMLLASATKVMSSAIRRERALGLTSRTETMEVTPSVDIATNFAKARV